ncbi:MAG: hypothetical protein Q9162_004054 [Coniocarpon cinnabarinum]
MLLPDPDALWLLAELDVDEPPDNVALLLPAVAAGCEEEKPPDTTLLVIPPTPELEETAGADTPVDVVPLPPNVDETNPVEGVADKLTVDAALPLDKDEPEAEEPDGRVPLEPVCPKVEVLVVGIPVDLDPLLGTAPLPDAVEPEAVKGVPDGVLIDGALFPDADEPRGEDVCATALEDVILPAFGTLDDDPDTEFGINDDPVPVVGPEADEADADPLLDTAPLPPDLVETNPVEDVSDEPLVATVPPPDTDELGTNEVDPAGPITDELGTFEPETDELRPAGPEVGWPIADEPDTDELDTDAPGRDEPDADEPREEEVCEAPFEEVPMPTFEVPDDDPKIELDDTVPIEPEVDDIDAAALEELTLTEFDAPGDDPEPELETIAEPVPAVLAVEELEATPFKELALLTFGVPDEDPDTELGIEEVWTAALEEVMLPLTLPLPVVPDNEPDTELDTVGGIVPAEPEVEDVCAAVPAEERLPVLGAPAEDSECELDKVDDNVPAGPEVDEACADAREELVLPVFGAAVDDPVRKLDTADDDVPGGPPLEEVCATVLAGILLPVFDANPAEPAVADACVGTLEEAEAPVFVPVDEDANPELGVDDAVPVADDSAPLCRDDGPDVEPDPVRDEVGKLPLDEALPPEAFKLEVEAGWAAPLEELILPVFDALDDPEPEPGAVDVAPTAEDGDALAEDRGPDVAVELPLDVALMLGTDEPEIVEVNEPGLEDAMLAVFDTPDDPEPEPGTDDTTPADDDVVPTFDDEDIAVAIELPLSVVLLPLGASTAVEEAPLPVLDVPNVPKIEVGTADAAVPVVEARDPLCEDDGPDVAAELPLNALLPLVIGPAVEELCVAVLGEVMLPVFDTPDVVEINVGTDDDAVPIIEDCDPLCEIKELVAVMDADDPNDPDAAVDDDSDPVFEPVDKAPDVNEGPVVPEAEGPLLEKDWEAGLETDDPVLALANPVLDVDKLPTDVEPDGPTLVMMLDED